MGQGSGRSDEGLFVGRTKEVEMILGSFNPGFMQPRVKVDEVFGAVGIGKTALLNEVERRGRERGIQVARIAMTDELDEQFLYDPLALIEELARQLSLDGRGMMLERDSFNKKEKPGEGIVGAYANLSPEQRLYMQPEWLKGVRGTVIEWIKAVNKMAVPTVLMYDESDNASIELLDWMEEWVINPISNIKHVHQVFTTMRPWRWKRPEIRRALRSSELKGLSKDEMGELWTQKTGQGIGENDLTNLFLATGGVPAAIWEVMYAQT